jgi:hypothetical protein
MTTYPRTAADAIHNSTKHGTPAAHPKRLVNYPRLDPGNAPTPFKKYRDLPVTPLSRELVGSTLPAVSVLSGERGDPSRLDASLVATILYLTAGVTRTTARSGGGRVFRPQCRREPPSSRGTSSLTGSGQDPPECTISLPEFD